MAGIAKAYNLPFDYVLYDMSYANMVMYGAVLPQYHSRLKDKKTGKHQKVIKADDRNNQEAVRKFFDNIQ